MFYHIKFFRRLLRICGERVKELVEKSGNGMGDRVMGNYFESGQSRDVNALDTRRVSVDLSNSEVSFSLVSEQ